MNNTQTIAVIAQSENDFRNFKLKHRHPEKVFVKVTRLEECKGRMFHDIDETEQAFLNDDYLDLRQYCKARLIKHA